MSDSKEIKLFREIGLIDGDLVAAANAGAAAGGRGRRRKKAAVLISAAALAVAIFVVSAAAYIFDFGYYFSNYFGGDYTMVDEITAAAEGVMYFSTNRDVKFEVMGFSGDSHKALVWLDITIPEWSGSDTDVSPVCDLDWDIKGGTAWGGGVRDVPTQKAPNVWSQCIIISGINESVIGRSVVLKITELKIGGRVYTGKWILRFRLEYPDKTKVYYPDVIGQRSSFLSCDAFGNSLGETIGYTVTGCTVRLSPIGVSFEFSFDRDATAGVPGMNDWSIVMKDGSVFSPSQRGSEIRIGGMSAMFGQDGEITTAYVSSEFVWAINPSDVAGINCFGLYLPIN